MNSRMVLLAITVVFAGMYAMPNTLSLFAGMHTFKNATGDNMCRTCHEDVYEGLHSPLNQIHWKRTDLTPDTQFQCTECHNVTNLSRYYNTNAKVKENAHAATTVPCLACHSGSTGKGSTTANPMHVLAKKYGVWLADDCGQCHSGDPPTVSNTYIRMINASFGPNEVHAPYYNDTINKTLLLDSNEACIGCHTRTLVSNTWARNTGYQATYDFQTKNITITKNETFVNTTTENQ